MVQIINAAANAAPDKTARAEYGKIGYRAIFMLWGWPFSLWELIVKLSLWIAVGAGVVTAIAAFVAGYVGYELTDAVQKEAEKAIADAKLDTKKAEERIAELNAHASELKRESEKLKADSVRIQNAALPRTIGVKQGQLLEKLKSTGPVPIIIISVSDFEAQRFTSYLFGMFKLIGWSADYIHPAMVGIDQILINDGIGIYAWDNHASNIKTPPEIEKARTVADNLKEYMRQDELDVSRFWIEKYSENEPVWHGPLALLTKWEPPKDTVVIVIGAKPPDFKASGDRSFRIMKNIQEKEEWSRRYPNTPK